MAEEKKATREGHIGGRDVRRSALGSRRFPRIEGEPDYVFVLARVSSPERDEGWSIRSSPTIGDDELLLGALVVQVERQVEECLAGWDDDEPSDAPEEGESFDLAFEDAFPGIEIEGIDDGDPTYVFVLYRASNEDGTYWATIQSGPVNPEELLGALVTQVALRRRRLLQTW